MDEISLTKIALAIVIANSTTTQLSFYIFLAMMAFDFATGILAAYIEQLKNPKEIKVYLVKSSRARESLVKLITYLMVIAFMYMFEITLKMKPFEFDNDYFQVSLTISNITILICAVIEFFSVLENAKRSGFDVIGKACELLDGLITAKEKITNLITKKDA